MVELLRLVWNSGRGDVMLAPSGSRMKGKSPGGVTEFIRPRETSTATAHSLIWRKVLRDSFASRASRYILVALPLVLGGRSIVL